MQFSDVTSVLALIYHNSKLLRLEIPLDEVVGSYQTVFCRQ